jgi:hypothetical protein
VEAVVDIAEAVRLAAADGQGRTVGQTAARSSSG